MKSLLVMAVAFALLSATLFFGNVGINTFGYVLNFVMSYAAIGLSGLCVLGYVEVKHKEYEKN